ncbi:type II/IV secretion system protein [Candidatus Falkowbacteria bacterium]|nr:type II/IV secretion system protein [Candidatus Falkowbacteria bacterium]
MANRYVGFGDVKDIKSPRPPLLKGVLIWYNITMHITDQKFKNILVGSGVVDEKTFDFVKTESQRFNQTIANALIGGGYITEDYLAELLEPHFDAPVINLKNVTLNREVIELVPETYAKSKGVILFDISAEQRGKEARNNAEKDSNIIKIAKVAMLDPLNYDTIEFLRAKTGAWIEPYLTTPSSLKYGLKQYKQKLGSDFNQIIAENVEKFVASSGEVDLSKMAEAIPIITILDSIVEHGVSLNASDIHFEPLADGLLVRFRIDGILHEMLNLNKMVEPILVARVKILAGLQIDEHRVPQDGRFRFEVEEGSNVDVRVNVILVMHGEKVEMRLLKSSARPFTLEELGLSTKAVKIVIEEIKKPHGMILVTGPTGHGKTTTLYAILHILNTPKVNITTIEDPIEYEVGRINQTQVNMKAGITFANGLRSLLRQNPDIIMIGEIRDNETVEIAVHAALTGHLVLSSLHTNDAPSALPRLLDMGAPAFLLASTVNLVIAQRLVRKICSSCVESYKISSEIKDMIAVQIALIGDNHIKKIPQTLFRGKGCKICGGSGFSGQIGIYELFKATDTIRSLLLKQAPVGEIRKQAIKEGMATMFEDGLAKVEKGMTTIEEIIRTVRE